MPVYEISAPNGKTYRIPGPAGATDAQVRAQVLRQFPEAGRPPKPSIGERAAGAVREVGRQAALTGRYAVEGLAGLAGIVTNPINATIDAVAGTNIGSDLQGVTGRALTEAGLPQPSTATERVVGDATRAVAAAAPVARLGQLVANTTTGVAQRIGQTLAAGRAEQAAYAAAGATTAGTAREMGASPTTQFVAGAVLPTTVAGVARGTAGMVTPFFRRGQEAIAARTFRDQASNPDAALGNLERYTPPVEGSTATTGAAARDMGLLAFEKGARARNPVPFAEQASGNNLARQETLDRVSRTAADIAKAQAKRDRVTSPMRDKAFASAGRAFADDVIANIDATMASPVGKRDAVQKALTWAREKIAGETDPRALYEVRKDLSLATKGKLGKDAPDFSLARKEVGQVIALLDDAIEKAAPGFKSYIARYRAMSRPIDQMERMQTIRDRSRLAVPDPATTRDTISQAKFSNLVRAELDDPKSPLTVGQKRVLKNVMADLDAGVAVNTNALRAPGSDTFQNFSLANVLGQVKMGKAGVPTWLSPVARPFSWLYKWSDEAIQELLVEAAKDPEAGAALLRKATPKNAAAASSALQRFSRQALGSTQGAAQVSQSRPAREGQPR